MTTPNIETSLTRLLGIQHPLLLAPMGGVSGGNLVAAVSRAGGLGMIGGGYTDPRWLRRELKLCSRVAKFGIGFITWSLDKVPSALQQALEHSPSVVMFSFGDFQNYLPQVRDSGAKIICQVQYLEEAKEAAALGIDAIVVQGNEAGGHGGGRGTFALVPAVADALPETPVIAAGGIFDGRGIAAALTLGASGVLLGTRFLAAAEALVAASAKERVISSDGDSTIRTRVFDIVSGIKWPLRYTGRALRNSFTDRWHSREADLHERQELEFESYRDAYRRKDFDTAVIYAGEAVDGVKKYEAASTIVETIMGQATAILAEGPASISLKS